MERALVVSQTTFISERFERVCAALQKRVRAMEIRKTICPATRERQEEAVRLAQSADVMIVVGGRESSNSRKLFELVKAVCPRSYFIEGAREVENTWIQKADRVGITAAGGFSYRLFLYSAHLWQPPRRRGGAGQAAVRRMRRCRGLRQRRPDGG